MRQIDGLIDRGKTQEIRGHLRQHVQTSTKPRAAQEALRRRFHRGYAPEGDCFALLDVLQLTCDMDPTPAVKDLNILFGLSSNLLNRTHPAQFLPYRRASWHGGNGSVQRLCIESDREAAWLPRFRVAMYANDLSGLHPKPVVDLLEVMPPTRITRLEVALDFPLTGRLSPEFVRKHCIFGKARRDFSATNPEVDRWGTRRSQKRVVSYTKHEVAAHRVELRFRRQFLERCGVRDIFDFHRLSALLPRRHIIFGRLDHEKLTRWLDNDPNLARRKREILDQVHEQEHDLSGVLDYLRRDVGLKNVRRLLVPLQENKFVREALRDWAAIWPKAPHKLKS